MAANTKYTLLPIFDSEKEQTHALFDGAPFVDHNVSAYSKEDFKSIFTYKSAFSDDRRLDRLQDQEAPSACCWCCSWVITISCAFVVFLTAPISLWFSFKMVQEYERMIIFRLGHLLPVRGSGLTMIFPCIDRVHKVDMRLRAFSVPPQQILTSDGGAVEMGAEVYLRVSDPVQCVLSVQDMDKSTRAIAQTSMQKLMRKYATDEIDLSRARICEEMVREINVLATGWGMEILRVELSPVKVLVQATRQPGALSNVYNALSSAFFGGNSNNVLPTLAGLPLSPPTGTSAPGSAPASAGPGGSIAAQPPPGLDAQSYLSPRQLLSMIQCSLSYEMVQQFGCVYTFNLHGPDGGQFYLDLKHGAGSVGEGDPPGGPSDVTLSLSVRDMHDILSGKVSAFNAYMSGNVEVTGDLRTALRLADIVGYIRV